MKSLCYAACLVTTAALATPLFAQTITVSSATPNSATQGTVNLNIAISGKGFKNGATSHFYVTGTTNPGGVAVNSTAFSGSTALIANITVSSGATISGYDVVVDNPDGHTGKGSDSFSVTAPAANGTKCSPAPLPAGVTLLATFNSTTGAPAYTSGIGKTTRGVLTTVAGRSVILAATVGTGGAAEVFFLDPVSGAILDGTFGQTHLTLPIPEPSFNYLEIGDLNNDGVPDLAMGAGQYGVAWVFLAQGGGANPISYPGYIQLKATVPTGNNAALAIGNLDGSTYNTLAVGTIGINQGHNSAPRVVSLYKFNGTGFTNYANITDPQNSSTSGYGFTVAIGDVTGDSAPDLIVGANGSNRVWVYPGPALINPFYVTDGSGTSDQFGWGVRVANITGVSGGFSDLIGVNTGSNSSAFVFNGPATAASTAALVFALGDSANYGTAFDAGDLDGDGLADVVNGSTSIGCSGSASIFLSSPSFHHVVIAGPLSNSNTVGYGSSAATIAGTKIVLVGDRYWTGPTGVQSGQVYVYSVQ